MSLAHRNYASARVLAPKGRLDHDSCDVFRADLAPHLEASLRERQQLVLDFSGIEYVSSAGLRCLMLAAKEAGARSGRMMVAAMQPVVAEIFQISRFNMVFEVFPTLREALASISPQAAEAFDRG
jgi:anti-sigma B factor antagonist